MMVLSTKDIKAVDPVTGDTVWDEPPTLAPEHIIADALRDLAPYDELDFLRAISTLPFLQSISSEIEKRAAVLRDQIQRTDR